MSKALKSTLALAAAGVAILGGTIAGVSQVSAYGPVDRPTYTYQDINSMYFAGTWPKSKIVFNSITDSKVGDERYFLSARKNDGTNLGDGNVWNTNTINVEDGAEYYIRLYVHNNSPWGDEGVAEDVMTKINVPGPEIIAKEQKLTGYINSSNAEQTELWDSVTLKSDQAFHLEYVYGSAVLVNNGIGKDGGITLSDDLVQTTEGVKIGYDALDGRIPGCYEYSSYVGIRVKVVYDSDYIVDKKVRLLGTTEWQDEIDANLGDKVEFQIEYRNTSTDGSKHNNVMIRDILPKNMRYVPGTTKLFNTAHPTGMDVVEDDVTTVGINVGNYPANSNVYIRFTAEIVDNSLQCGDNMLVNWAQAGVGQKTIQDYAAVYTTKVCTEEEELPKTGPEALAGGVIATGSVVTAAGYYIASRRSLR